MLLTAAVGEGQWWWAVVVLVGGLLAGGYVFLVLARALGEPRGAVVPQAEVAKGRQMAALLLALLALGLGFVPLRPAPLLLIGRPSISLASLGW
jgi:hypothetical protein